MASENARLEELERKINRYRVWLVAGSLLILLLIALQATSFNRGTITAERIKVLNKDGESVLQLKTDGYGAGVIQIYNQTHRSLIYADDIIYEKR